MTIKKSPMLEAAEAMKILTKARGPIQATHCVMEEGMCKMTDGIISVGYPTGTDVMFVPKVSELIELSKNIAVDEDTSFTIMDGKLTAVMGDKKLTLSGADRSLLKAGTPDREIAPMTDAIRGALDMAVKVLDPKSHDLRMKNAFLNAGSLIASNSKIAIEYHHGIDLPPELPIPFNFMKAVLRIKSPISGFGYSPLTVTFWFENGAYVRSRLDQAQMPDVSNEWSDFPTDWLSAAQFMKSAEAISKFSPQGFITVDGDRIEAFQDEGESWIENFDTCGIVVPEGTSYDTGVLMKLKRSVKDIAWGKDSKNLFFTDQKTFRGVTTAIVKPDSVLYTTS
jgi:hypothetical protein